jgi:O-antigen/teichoic acid export membrane protein
MTDTTDATTRHLGHVARGGAIGLAGAVASALSGFALVIVVTRGFPLAQAGVFFAATSAFLVLSTLSSLGTDTGLARFLLRYESEGRHSDVRRVLWAAVVPVLVLAFLLAAALWFAAGPVSTVLGLGRDGEQLLQALGLLLPFAVVSDLSLSAIRAFGRMGSTAVVDRLLRAGLQTIAAAVVVVLDGGLLALVVSWGLAYVVSSIVSVVLLRVFLHRRLGGMLTDPVPVVREFWAFTWPRGLSKLSQIGIQKADIVIVAALLNPTAAAVYTAATRFVALGQFATQALQQVLQPRFTAILLKDDRETLRQVYRISTAWNILLTWPIYLLIGCAPMAYLSIFGGRYSAADGAAEVVVVMTLAMLLAVASGPVDTLLLMAGRSRTSLINAVSALLIDLGLCVLLLPPLGIAGAGIAWAAAVLTRCALAYLQVRHQLRVVPLAQPVFVAAGVGIGVLALPMTVFSLVAPDPVGEWPGAVAVLSVCYLAVLWLCRKVLCLDLLAAAVLRPRASARKSADASVVAGSHRP